MKKSLLFYLLIIGVFLALIWFIVEMGADLRGGTSGMNAQNKVSTGFSFDSILTHFSHNIVHPLSILLLQIIVILAISRIFGQIAKRFGQPAVIGEIIAGIFLGPSIVGMFSPELFDFLFPKSSMPNLQFLSQIGLALFMFIVGMELDLSKLKNKTHSAIVVSHASIILPYFLGVLLSYFIFEKYAPAGIPFLSFALFMGIAMSITAFPVLARIIQERGLTKTTLGTLAITCAAADDITAWCILAAVIAIVKAGSALSALFTIGLSVIFVLMMLKVVKPLLKKLNTNNDKGVIKNAVAIAFFILLLSAYIAEIIGIHALFGAFLAGVIVPDKQNFKHALSEKIEDISLLMLLPVFFAFSGLRTQISLLNESNLWGVCLIIIGMAVIGKFGGSALAAKFVGQNWKDSLSLGAMMNTRGLVELVVLNIGYDLGVITPEIFAMMVLMALTTTFMTGPSLDAINYLFRKNNKHLAQ